MELSGILKEAVQKGASDILIMANSAPVVRISGKLSFIGKDSLTKETAKETVYSILTKEQIAEFEKEKELDCSYELASVSRFRVNVHFQKESVAASLRTIPSLIPTAESLKLPQSVHDFIDEPRGLILVTGPTGSGKSTTQAAMVNMINTSRSCHIITIEDPIEFLHKNIRSIIEQREVGIDTGSFPNALNHVLRQDPDVILIGEMRELDTISTAITAAETGHLVISTLHTNDSVQSIDRMVDVFPPHQQNQVRIQLSLTLQGVVSQQLIPKADNSGQVLAAEILKVTPAVRNIIRKGSTQDIYSMMEIGSNVGMITMDNALKKLYQNGVITKEAALSRAISQENLARLIGK